MIWTLAIFYSNLKMAGTSSKAIVPFVIFPFAIIMSAVCWVWSVLCLACSPSELPSQTPVIVNPTRHPKKSTLPSKQKKLTITTETTESKIIRPRAFSDPNSPRSPTPFLKDKRLVKVGRARRTTLSASTVDADPPVRRQKLLRVFSSYTSSSNSEKNSTYSSTASTMRPSAFDEQHGKTCPPIWWQKRRIQLDLYKQPSLELNIQEKKIEPQTPPELGHFTDSADDIDSLDSANTATTSSPTAFSPITPTDLRVKAMNSIRLRLSPKLHILHHNRSADEIKPSDSNESSDINDSTQPTGKYRKSNILRITRRLSSPHSMRQEFTPNAGTLDLEQDTLVEKNTKLKVFTRITKWKKNRNSIPLNG
ncbi:hypothetical protein BDF14DRAFT_1799906 [Spinellus fusiger]|nr:hypothetical protein BDF14DRAFT_1799906 [Spinellus fusiger]